MKPRSSAEGVVVAAVRRPHAGGGRPGSCRATRILAINGHALRRRHRLFVPRQRRAGFAP